MFAAVKSAVKSAVKKSAATISNELSIRNMVRHRMTQISRCWTEAQRRRRAIEAAIMQRRLFGAIAR